jgi:hypothetical protein
MNWPPLIFTLILAVSSPVVMGLLDWAIHRRPNYVRHARF